MSDSDTDLKTDDDDTPPPQGRTRNSMDETEELAQLQNQTLPASPSPRPPPSDPPPPVPPSKPKKEEIVSNSNDILLNLESLEINKKHQPTPNNNSSRRGLRRRRASLPSINILPSFKSLKSVMGFGVDEDIKEEKETNNNQNNNNQNDKPKRRKKSIDNNINKSKDKNTNDNDKDNKVSNDKNKTLNKKLNPKEIKQLYIKNLKLQAQIDKYREREKEFEYKLSEQLELVSELKNQVNAKSEVVKKLDGQLSRETDDAKNAKNKLQELERLLVEKDTTIQSLKQSMLKIEKNMNNNSLSPSKNKDITGNLSPSVSDDKHGNKAHSRSLTPGGYQLDSVPWDIQSDEKLDSNSNSNSNPNPSAPPSDLEFLDDKIHGLSLSQKLSQRPSWKELQSRGILYDDPTTKKSQSLQQAHRTLHKRKASQKLDSFLINRPNIKKLKDTNIIKNTIYDDDNEYKNNIPTNIKMDNGLDLNQKLAQRPQWNELNSRGILLDDPTTKKSQSLQAAQRQLHKRKASKTLDKLLINRPSPNQLHQQNIIDANTAAMFFGASPTTQVITPKASHYMGDDQYSAMMDATEKLYATSAPVDSDYKAKPNDDIIYKDNIDKPEISDRLERNLRQRPSIDETISRGILMFRTDTKLNYDLQQRHKQLHKRKASQNLEKLMLNRPKPKHLEQKGILIQNEKEKERKKHKRKTSQDLEAGLKKRMSITEMQGLGLLFSDKGYEFKNINEENDNNDVFMNDNEHNANIAGLFRQGPRSSKPLHDTDFKGIDDLESETKESTTENKRRGSVDNSFEPFKLTKKQRISRIGDKLSQRPSVEDMRMRGLLFEHPSISKSLVERKRDLMKRRASNKIDSLLQNRPNRTELENKNILLAEDETLEKRRRHKRKRSQNLENAIQRRPKLMEEKEAQRQRRKSMDDSDFTPDYLQHILNDDEEDDMHDIQQIEIRFLNIGGFVIPLVSPKFMGDLAGGPPMHAITGGDMMDDFSEMNNNNPNNINVSEMEAEMERLCEELDDYKMQITHQEAQIKQKDNKIRILKGENSNLKQDFSRKSLMDLNHLDINNNNNKEKEKEKEKELEHLKSEIASTNNYISKLRYYLKEEKDIEIPSAKQLSKRSELKNKLNQHFKQRPSFMDLQEKQILSSNFINDVTNQNAQIADRKLKFRRTSDLISNFLASRPSKESLEEYFTDSLDYNKYMNETGNNENNNDIVMSNIIVDNATKNELREEILRLNNKLIEKIQMNNKLEKENETMRFKIEEKFNENTINLGRNLKAYSMNETTIMDQAIKEAEEENRKIQQLKGENDQLKQKIRRLSTVDIQTIETEKINTETEMKQFVNWSKQQTFIQPFIQSNINNINDFLLMQKIFKQIENNSNNQLFEINKLKENNNINTNKINELQLILNKQQREHLNDKNKLINTFNNELDRLRNEIKKVGKQQQQKQQQIINQQKNNDSYSSYVSGATQYFWKK